MFSPRSLPRFSFLLSPFSLLFALASAPAGADLTVIRKVREETVSFADRAVRHARTEQIRIRPECVRLEDVTLGQVLIVRLDRKKLIQLDHLKRTAAEIDLDALAARREAAIRGVRDAHALVAGTPEGERLAGVLRAYGVYAGGPPKVERRVTGEKAQVAGRETARVQIAVDGEPALDLWVAADLGDGRWYAEALAALRSVPPEVAAALREAGGFPLRADVRRSLFLDRVHEVSEVRSVFTDPVPAAEFEPPADYRKVPFDLIPEETGEEIRMPLPGPANEAK